MKILSSFSFVACVLSICLLAVYVKAEDQLKWTENDFNSLSQEEKIKFVRDLREVIVSLDEKSDFFTLNVLNSGKLPLWARLILSNASEAASDVEVRKSFKTDSYVEASRMAYREFLKATQNASGTLTEKQAEYGKVTLSMLLAEAKRLEKTNDIKAKKELAQMFAIKKKDLFAYNLPAPTRKTMGGINDSFYKIVGQENPEQNANVSKAKSVSQPKVETQKDVSATAASDYTYSACLYAGFVIQENVCKAPKKLPKNELLNQLLNVDTFKCKNEDEVICNPLLFGFETDCQALVVERDVAKKVMQSDIIGHLERTAEIKECLKKVTPVCAPNSLTVTASCEKKTANENYLKRSVDLISAEPKLIEQFVKDIDQLCNKDNLKNNRLVHLKADGKPRKNVEAIKTDILKTCEVAKPKLKQVLDQYRKSETNPFLKNEKSLGPAKR